MEEFDRNPLRFEGFQNGIDNFGLIVKADTAVTEAVVCWDVLSMLFTGEIELVLDRRFSTHTMVCQTLHHTFEESAWAGLPGCAIIKDHIAHHASTAWCIG